jgi:RecA-family ATPase
MSEMPAEAPLMTVKALEAQRKRMEHRRANVVQMASTGHELVTDDGVLDPLQWEGRSAPQRQWIVPGLVPRREVTLLTGVGGEGKSLLAAQLQFATSHGGRWLGRRVRRINSLSLFCEDNKEEIWRRFEGISNGEGIGFSENMIPVCRKGKDNVIYEADNYDMVGRTTAFYDQIRRTIDKHGAQLLILDSLYNFFGGNENIRPQANRFIGHLGKIAEDIDGSVLIIAHPSMAGITSKSGRAGSTAWHDAVRSRLYLHRLAHPSGDLEKEGPLVVQHMKANYALKEKPTEIVWEHGRFVPVADPVTPPAHWNDLGDE